MSGISLSLSSQSSVLCSPASPFLKDTHTYTERLEFCLFTRLSVCVRVFPDRKPTASPEQRSLPAALQAFCHPPLLRLKMSLSSGMQIRTRGFIPRSCWPFSYLPLPLSPSPSRRWRPWLRDDSRLPRWSSAKHSPDHGVHPGREECSFILLQFFFKASGVWSVFPCSLRWHCTDWHKYMLKSRRKAWIWPLVLVWGLIHIGFGHRGLYYIGWNMRCSKI